MILTAFGSERGEPEADVSFMGKRNGALPRKLMVSGHAKGMGDDPLIRQSWDRPTTRMAGLYSFVGDHGRGTLWVPTRPGVGLMRDGGSARGPLAR